MHRTLHETMFEVGAPPRRQPTRPQDSGTGARVEKYKMRHWAAYDADGKLVCVCVYRKGAEEVIRRITAAAD